MGAEIVESASGDNRPQEENGERKLPSIRPALTEKYNNTTPAKILYPIFLHELSALHT
jgi:hypothetical protein